MRKQMSLLRGFTAPVGMTVSGQIDTFAASVEA
jgi:hypothetical protein